MKPMPLLVTSIAFVAALSSRSEPCGLQFDGTNPHTTGCDANAITVCSTLMCDAWGMICSAKVELRYSTTCHTAWSRLSGGFQGGGISAERIHRNQDGCTYEHMGFFSAGYSNQLYDGVGKSAFAHGFAQSTRGEVDEDGDTCSW